MNIQDKGWSFIVYVFRGVWWTGEKALKVMKFPEQKTADSSASVLKLTSQSIR